MKKNKKKLETFQQKYQNFLDRTGLKRYPHANYYYGFRVKPFYSEDLEVYEGKKFKIVEFDVPFKNFGVTSINTECLVRYDRPKEMILLHPLEDIGPFNEEAVLEISPESNVTSTRTFKEFFGFLLDNKWFEFNVFIFKNFIPKFDIAITQTDFKKNTLRFAIYIPDNQIYETFNTNLFCFDKKFTGRLITLFITDLDKHFFAQAIDPYDFIAVSDIYKGVYEKQLVKDLPLITLDKPAKLKPDLKGYQISAVQWMLHRELDTTPKEHQILFEKFVFPDKQAMFVHKVFGAIITPMAYNTYLNTFPRPQGGILADEMGLGKTVETIALILQNPCPTGVVYPYAQHDTIFDDRKNIKASDLVCLCGSNQTGIIDPTPEDEIINRSLNIGFHEFEHPVFGFLVKCLHCGNYQHLKCQSFEKYKREFPYVCNRCWLKVKKIKSPATLIVCPKSILEQWKEELKKHAPDVTCFQFRGIINYIESGTSGVVYPPQLAKHDIVLTTYDVLAREIDFVSRFDISKLRHHKRFLAPNTPLLSINWHRLCLDEAQMIGFSKAFEMAQSIQSTYRWAISGTPIERYASEMKNLFAFIGEEPFSHPNLTERIISLDSTSTEERRDFFFDAISNCLWRTPKCMVIDEIGLKPPIVSIEKLEMSQFERDFYQQTYGALTKTRTRLGFSKDKPVEVNILLNQFIRLRKICCCPSAVGQAWITSRTNVEEISVEDRMVKVLESMILNAKKEAVIALRTWIMHMNSSSALYIQYRQYDKAVFIYRQTLKFIDEVGEDFKADSIQLIHIYYNYARILTLYGCEQISKTGESLTHTLETLIQEDGNEEPLPTGFCFEEDDQYCAWKAMQFSNKYFIESDQVLVNVFESICKSDDPVIFEKKSKTKFQWYISVLKMCERKDPSFFQAILPNIVTNYQMNQVGSPDLLIMQANRIVSMLKKVHEEVMEMFDIFYEHDFRGSDFYRYYDCHISKQKDAEKCLLCMILEKMNDLCRSMNIFNFNNWKDSVIFSMLYKLSIYWKSDFQNYQDYEFLLNESKIFFDYFKALYNDFKYFRDLADAYNEVINRYDELRQTKSLYRVEKKDEYSVKLWDSLAQQNLAMQDFEHKRHHVRYLRNLHENVNKESVICCICLENFEEFVILPCGHFNCEGCFQVLRQGNTVITCCICRTKTTASKVHHAKKKFNEELVHAVTGQSTKFKHITVRIKDIILANEKVLVFSSWTEILEELYNCLKENSVLSRYIKSTANFAERLNDFRKTEACHVLLLPFNLAAKGLNLIEANHVVFVDIPIQSADELQAIGRVHRIGQTRQTYVHKFIMANTIEEILESRIPHTDESTKYGFDTNQFFLEIADSLVEV